MDYYNALLPWRDKVEWEKVNKQEIAGDAPLPPARAPDRPLGAICWRGASRSQPQT